MLTFDKDMYNKYNERCKVIQEGFLNMAADKVYFNANDIIYIENATEREWDENVRVLAGDGEDEGSWKILIPFEEHIGLVFRMHVITGFTLIAYDMIYGEGSFNKVQNLDEYKSIFGNISRYFNELAKLDGEPLPVEVKNEG